MQEIFLRRKIILEYQVVTEQQKTPLSENRYITGSSEDNERPYFKGF